MAGRKGMLNLKLYGSYTVEASLILPFILFLMISIIYFSFYMHDECTLIGVCNREIQQISYEESTLLKSSDFVVKDYKKRIKAQLQQRLLLSGQIEVELEFQSNRVSLSIQSKEIFPFRFLSLFIKKETIEVTRKVKIHNPTRSVRLGCFLYDLISNLNAEQDHSQVLGRLQEFIK